ncbi:acyltransferase [Nocardioides baekrokdamisoli]|uniref:Acyltransferase n=1 Tax=Nocardioides baekrokdamisoli TaxID=1804624 RepID=A0A3G9J0D3_9ACTN|nr:acyltransferase [Nocardioides baekrokdamisoli]BBH17098.1 acyltransferase [Nocardioides baekrokdamisoli]
MTHYRGLHGLRGLAALTVVISHALLTDNRMFAVTLGKPVTGASAWITYSPLHLFWDASEAVIVFFVLSGFVLALPFVHSTPIAQWLAYYPRRLARLLLPIWAAVALAFVIAVLIPRSPDTASSWVDQHAHAATLHNAAQAAVVRGDLPLNTPLWTMKWEIMFSLLLPAYVLGGRLLRKVWLPMVVLAILVGVWGGHRASAYIAYLPVFAVGTLLALGRERWMPWFGRLTGWRMWLVLVAALGLLNVHWATRATAGTGPGNLWIPGSIVLAAGALVCLFAATPAVAAFGTHRVVAWLGQISFSLYLIHEPIVVSIAQIDGGRMPWPATLAIALPASIAAAAVFHRWVEAPAHRLSRRIGNAFSSR